MRAKDVMSTDVVTVMANATVYDAGELLLSEHISAMPVIGETGEIVGIISEADLIRRAEIGTEPHKSWLLRLLADDFTKAAQYVHSHSRQVRDVMTRPVITVKEDATLAEIAQLMVKHDIKRVPVTRKNFVVGIVSRANLVQALLSREPDSHSVHPANQQLRKDVLKAVEKQAWSSSWPTNVFVNDGVVHLWGLVQSEAVRKAYRVAAENVPGVKSVKNHLRMVPPLVHISV